ncbi:MAG: response regulator [Bacteroidales bacterium]|nr:response regulator [Bacteroidales bacterium]
MSKSLTILVIEPSQTEQFLYSEIFSSSDFQLLNCDTGSEAFSILSGGNSIDMIITDLYLTDIIGLSLIEKLRQHTNIPIVIVSSIPFKIHEIKHIENVEAFYKPYNMAQLMKTVLRFSKV